ncbi:toll/interleukin-1 receptor domain-containing protein [Leptothoe sp. ISB3NOV94-8A]
MQVFISWSGSRSKTLAVHLHEWIKTVVQRAEPWMSERDIEAGQQWNSQLSLSLKESDFGIICLTPENLNAPWLLFEAGSLAKALNTARVIPLLLGLKKADLSFPLAQFQSVEADRDGFFALASAVNSSLPEGQLDKTLLNNIFNGLWSGMDHNLKKLQETSGETSKQEERTDREILEDVLTSVRALQRITGPSAHTTEQFRFRDWEDHFILGINLANKRGGDETNNESLRNYAQAIAIAPDDLPKNTLSRLYAYYSAMLKRVGRLEEAKNSLVLAQKLASEDREINDAMYNMACVLAMTGEADGALEQLSSLIARDPSWAKYIDSNPYFSSIAETPEFKSVINAAD